MSDPIVLWRRDADPSLPALLPVFTVGYHLDTDAEYHALPAEEFARMKSDALAYHRVLDVIADPRLRDAPIGRTLADLGLDRPAGPPVKMMYFTSGGGPYPVPPAP